MQAFQTAHLNERTLSELLDLEQRLSEQCGEPIVLVAYTSDPAADNGQKSTDFAQT